MKKKKLLLALLPFMLIGCGGGGGSTPTPTPEEVSYTITFNNEEGKLIESKKWKENTVPSCTYDKPDTAEYDYTVEGWSESLGGSVIEIPKATKDAIYYAVVTSVKKKYTITFECNQGSVVEPITAEYGTTINKPNDPTLEGHSFEGWFSDSTLQKAVSWPLTLDKNYTLYAKWEILKFNITFNDENGDLIETKVTNYGEVPSCSYTKTDTQEWDYTMHGWSLTLGGDVITIPQAKADATYFANVTKVKQVYTLKLDHSDGKTVDKITEEYGTQIAKPKDPTRDGYAFVCWCTDSSLKTSVTWPFTLVGNTTFYAKWNEKIDMKGMLKTAVSALGQDPYSYIPDSMRDTYSQNHVQASDVTYDFTSFTNVSSIKYGGFGEQWHMVIDNINQSEKFYAVTLLADTALSAAVTAFNNWFDKNPSDTNKSLDETGYYAKVDFKNNVLSFTLQLKTKVTIPLLGEFLPQIDITYNTVSLEKAVRFNLSDTNAMRYVITEDSYTFALKYGVSAGSRTALFQASRNEDEEVTGHIYEYITLKDKDAVKSCADFYINDEYVSVVGNKASGILLMNGYINELYTVNNGKLLGYKVMETKTVAKITATYHTLWFNLNNITGINSVKAVEKQTADDLNPHDVYVNGNTKTFTPAYNTVALVKTSRKFDIELRKQYWYGFASEELVEYETKVPMMFIQDNHDDYHNYDDFVSDMKDKNGITTSVTLASKYLTKIRADYEALIPVFIENKDKVNSDAIEEWIGEAVK